MRFMNKNPIYARLNNSFFIFGLILSLFMISVIVTGFFWTPFEPAAMSVETKFNSPCIAHPFGCDNMGRDILSRVMIGSGFTLTTGFFTVVIGLFFGIIIGAFTGYYGGIVDEIIMRINDAVLAFPGVLLALIFVSVFGVGKEKLIITLGIIFIPGYTRMIRGEVIKLKNKDFVSLARLMKASDLRIIFVHILPNALPVIISTIAIGFNNAILAEAALSFIGVGVRPDEASLGKMLSESQGYIATAPWYSLFTGGFIVLLILGFSMISEGIARGKRNAESKQFNN